MSHSLNAFYLPLVASGGGHDDTINWIVVVCTVLNAIIFFGFLAVKLKGPLAGFLRDRRTRMQADIEAAQAKKKEAEAKLKVYEDRIQNLEDEVKSVVAAYEREAQTEKQKLEEDAKRTIARLEKEAEFQIQQEVKKAEISVREAAVAATVAAAERIIKDRITDQDKTRLADEAIRSLRAPAA